MSIRLKLALILSAGIAAATFSSCFVFLRLQTRALRSAESAQVRLLMDSVARMAEESRLANDPLMLFDYLAFLRKDRREVRGCRLWLDGKWQEVGGPVIRDQDDLIERAPNVEVYFSRSALAEREREASAEILRNLGRSSAAVVLLGILFSILLSGTLTRRIVRIERQLKAIGEGKLGERMDARGSDEIGRLARGVNQMSDRLKEVDEMKRTFIASVTHELRSPLGAIQSHIKAIMADPTRWQETERENLERIRRNASRLEHFVTNLLEMSKIERGKLDFFPRMGNLVMLAEDTVAFFAPRAKEAGIELRLEAALDMPALRLDPDLTSQVLANLISNAIKFTRPGGSIQVSIRMVPGSRPEAEGSADKEVCPAVECAVADTGVGIPAEALARIFKPFERVRNPLRATGAGLGLAISKSIVEMHGGRIGATSEPGKGSRFYFLLPT